MLFILLIIYILISIFISRFQRVTLNLTRMVANRSDNTIQADFTPPLFGAIGWVMTALLILNVILFGIYVHWLWSVGIIIYGTFGLAFIDVISPFPSYKFCLDMIHKQLRKDSVDRLHDSAYKSHYKTYIDAVSRAKKDIKLVSK